MRARSIPLRTLQGVAVLTRSTALHIPPPEYVESGWVDMVKGFDNLKRNCMSLATHFCSSTDCLWEKYRVHASRELKWGRICGTAIEHRVVTQQII